MEKMSGKETVKRYVLFIISLFFCGLGVAFTKHAELGVSPISSIANVVSIKFDFIRNLADRFKLCSASRSDNSFKT